MLEARASTRSRHFGGGRASRTAATPSTARRWDSSTATSTTASAPPKTSEPTRATSHIHAGRCGSASVADQQQDEDGDAVEQSLDERDR